MPGTAVGLPSKLSPIFLKMSQLDIRIDEYVCEPSLISNLRPIRGLSDRAMAIVLASSVAKSTYANLTNMIRSLL